MLRILLGKHFLLRGIFDFGADGADWVDGIKMLRIFGD
jgi:hypothetical protein